MTTTMKRFARMWRRRGIWIALVSSVGMSGMSGRVEAGLIGDVVTVEVFDTTFSPDPLSSDDITVEAGLVEITCPAPLEFCDAFVTLDGDSLDIESDSILLGLVDGSYGAGGFVGYRFSSLDWTSEPGRLVGFDLLTNVLGLETTDIEFTATTLSINFESAVVPVGGFALVELNSAHVPEPGALSLVLLGLAGLGRVLRPSRKLG